MRFQILMSLLISVLTLSGCSSSDGSDNVIANEAQADVRVNGALMYSRVRASLYSGYSADGALVTTDELIFDPVARTEGGASQLFLSESDEPVTGMTTYSYDERGRLEDLTAVVAPVDSNVPGSVSTTLSFELTYNDEQVDVITVTIVGQEGTTIEEVRYSVDDENRIIRAEYFEMPANALRDSWNRTYHDDGWTTTATGEDGDIVKTTTLNERGQVAQIIKVSGTLGATSTAEQIFYYDDADRLTQVESFDEVGALVGRAEVTGYTDVGGYYHIPEVVLTLFEAIVL